MPIVLIIIAIIGIVFFFRRARKRLEKAERVKVSPDMMQQDKDAALNSSARVANSFKRAMSWKRKAVDYKQLNQTYNQADFHFSKGDLREAEKGFIRVIALKEDHPESNNKLGIIYMKQEQFKKAEAIFRFLVETYPSRALYYSNLGRVLYSQERLAEAAEAYERAVQLDNTRIERYLSLGQVYKELKDIRKAVKAFSKALEQDIRNEGLYFLIVDLLEELQAYDQAIAYLEAMLDQFPYNDEAKQRIREYKRRLKISPLSTEDRKNLANTIEKQKTLFKDIEAGESVSQKPAKSKNKTDQKEPPSVSVNQQITIDEFELELEE